MSCDILEGTSLTRLPEYVERGQPVILRGLAGNGSQRVFRWSARYFLDVLGDSRLPVLESANGFLSYERDLRPMPYKDFVAQAFTQSETGAKRLYFKNALRVLPDGEDDSEDIEVIGPYIKRALMKNLWISPGGITVGLHFDHAENLNLQIRGHKRFSLYPPGVRGYYPLRPFTPGANISAVTRHGPHPDPVRHPRFRPERGIHVEVLQGDVLYLPAYWWHQVASLGDENVNLNAWWLPTVRRQLWNWNQALRGYSQTLARYLKYRDLAKAPPAEEGSRDAA